MENVDTLIAARWVVPVEPAGRVLEHHTIAVRGGRIVALLPSAEAGQRFQARESVHLPDHVVIPGLINAHTHAAMSLFRGLADDLALMDWLNNHIWPAESRWVQPDFVRDGTQLAIAEMLRGGITCFSDMYFFPDETARTASDAGMRAVVGMITIDFPTAWAADPEEYLHKGLQVHDQYKENPLIRTTFAPHAPYTVSDEPLRRIQVLAEELDVPIHMHVQETEDEIGQSLAKHNERPMARLQRLGLLSPRLLAVHMTQLTNDEIQQVAAAGAHVMHCPESNLKLASGICPVNKLARAGVNVALGTDGTASNNDLDMFGEMRTAALLGKVAANDPRAVDAVYTLSMATINGARALGLDQEVGSLVPGKWADITAVSMASIENQPMYEPISQLVYVSGRESVTDVWVAGKRLLKGRSLTGLDESAIIRKAAAWRDKIAASDKAPK